MDIILGISSLFLAVMTYLLQRRTKELEDHLHSVENESSHTRERLRKIYDHIRDDPIIDYQYIDIVLLGPRNAGKTSIGLVWTSPWTQIQKIRSTSPTDWREYEANIFEFPQKRCRDEIFELTRPLRTFLRIRVHDYPGEPAYLTEALEDLRDLKQKVVLVFVFNVGFHKGEIQYCRENAEYFSYTFVEEIERHLKRVSGYIAKAIVVFNKSDLLPQEWSEQEAIDKLQQSNSDGMHQIMRVFHNFSCRLTSAKTNKGIINLLSEIGRVAVPDADMEKYSLSFDQLEKEVPQ